MVLISAFGVDEEQLALCDGNQIVALEPLLGSELVVREGLRVSDRLLQPADLRCDRLFRKVVDLAVIFVPSLDDERPSTLSKRVVTDILREELGFRGVILSDDLEMKAIAGQYAVPSAAVMAIEAGCDGVLICSADHDTQAASLEALVHAVEEGRIPLTRIDDALARQQRAKERFFAAPLAARPRQGPALREVVGCDTHRAVADEMSRFL